MRSSISSRELPDNSDLTQWTVNIMGCELQICDTRGSRACPAIFREVIRNELGLLDVKLPDGATMVDVGANVGIPAILLAKRFPKARIFAFEPIPENYANLLRNIEANGVRNIEARNVAITGDGRPFDMTVALGDNSGGGSGQVISEDKQDAGYRRYTLSSMTLDQVFEELAIESCDLLKIDCEGSEHEILDAFKQIHRVARVIGEAHLNRSLEEKGYSYEKLEALLKPLGRRNYTLKRIRMAD